MKYLFSFFFSQTDVEHQRARIRLLKAAIAYRAARQAGEQ